MSNQNALTIYDQFDQLERAADALFKSGYFPDASSQAKAIVKVMAGAELGLPPFASMAGINIIQGKPALGANIIATLVKNDPRYDYQIEKATDEECLLIWFEGGKRKGTSNFTIAEAQRAGLTSKDTWKKYPSDMLFARAITRGARRYAPGIFGGSPIYTPEELGADTDEEGNIIIEAQVREVQKPPVAETQQASVEQKQPIKQPAKQNGGAHSFPGAWVQEIIKAQLAENAQEATGMLAKSNLKDDATIEQAVAWARLYRGWRDTGSTPEQAAGNANEGKQP